MGKRSRHGKAAVAYEHDEDDQHKIMRIHSGVVVDVAHCTDAYEASADHAPVHHGERMYVFRLPSPRMCNCDLPVRG